MKKDNWQDKQAESNLQKFIRLAKLVASRKLKITSLNWDHEQFGHERIVLFVEKGENNEQGKV